ncbi:MULTISPECIES: glutamine amidotransferase family protein [unclassified Neptuniibacter]|jgi:glutamate synthase domain-containing protein 1|uniref:class II glutamine amidotransferase n=1 Tax=unclassified Neptuniibacter TaxID=2630693 RepID=UPI0026E46FA4|nr:MULTISPECIES: glutamine amidotransferase family protein [unclassified Neptuniibacter]MDO6513553.1 glutamine amidotransferase family protein [Neptuniibacter sp. 2_MG-2023]MDO6593699.1 glutamine amidotransferase family protein [Neptuniibacter sp. 1_MG-2023]
MCGIVGLYLKNKALESQLGALFTPMLIAMTDRGPDSAGFAIYGDEVPDGSTKLTLRHIDENYDWGSLAGSIKDDLDVTVDWFKNSKVAVFKVGCEAEVIQNYLAEKEADILILSAGQSIEILKEVGLPENIAETFNLASMKGSHIIGHTRMATESAVTMEGSHPFSTGQDLCLVHNGSLSNHNRLREELKREGVTFQTENDSEVAAGYLTNRLRKGDTLNEALQGALKDLDGFFTFTIGTRDGFAVVRDPIACKPAVMAETDDYVAMASEYQALTTLPGIENAKVWEPEPETIYVWERDQ